MMLHDPIYLHVCWRAEFESMGLTEGESDPETVANDQICDLGRWLASRGENFKKTAAFTAIAKAHADFHQDARKVAELAVASQGLSDWRSLTEGDRYLSSSQRLIDLLAVIDVGVDA